MAAPGVVIRYKERLQALKMLRTATPTLTEKMGQFTYDLGQILPHSPEYILRHYPNLCYAILLGDIVVDLSLLSEEHQVAWDRLCEWIQQNAERICPNCCAGIKHRHEPE